MSENMASEVEIDDSLYSRQRYVLGDSAMQRLARSDVLLCGVGGLGVEIAKNIILAGVKSLTVQDDKVGTFHDLGTQFFLREEDVTAKKNRAEASVPRLAELNPYVSVKIRTESFNETTSLEYLKDFQCVVLTETSLEQQLRVNYFCRHQQPPIAFITTDVYGVFSWTFVDFGDDFSVEDVNGEEPKEVFIEKITKGKKAVVETLRNVFHNLETGDVVTFREVNGMTAINGKSSKIKVLSPCSFQLEEVDTTPADFAQYEHGGIFTQVKVPRKISFKSMEEELKNPTCIIPDLSKYEAPINIHIAMLAMYKFRDNEGRLPNVRCTKDADVLLQIATELNTTLTSAVDSVDDACIRNLSFTCQGCFAPFCAAIGGIVAQEALKSVTGKFTPLCQWLHLDACEVLSGCDKCDAQQFSAKGDRYDALRACIGDTACQQLRDLKLFMVGCGAIGCEMLKNYAMLGLGTSERGKITVTDMDLIEKSNLNRQFLFRPHHIRQPKSTTGAQSAKEINPELKIKAQQHRVCPQTESAVYTDAFFEDQDVMVNALDNIEARRYMDSRCVTNQRPLLESGTMGTKGHVQVIVPHLSESYTSQRDPPDEDIPYCTLKSFPAVIEHCIQWARDKFESSFTQKPAMFTKFWNTNLNRQTVIDKLENGASIEGAVHVSKLVERRPSSWNDCVCQARLKFEKYFNHKAKHLLHAFPLDTRLNDGSLFWQSPKRPPVPVVFNAQSSMHMDFVISTARLYADICGVPWTEQDVSKEGVAEILQCAKVPEFIPSNKKIETDESSKKSSDSVALTGDELVDAAARMKKVQQDDAVFAEMYPLSFEKDDDSNGHIDFITAASNLRASTYKIDAADRLKTKRIAGRIVPAIATTTAAVAGLVTVELIKLMKKAPLEHYKNCFLNLALPVMLFSEPGVVEKQTVRDDLTFSQWDRWEVYGNKAFTLQNFMDHFKEKLGLDVALVVHGVKMVYVPIMPGHKKRVTHTMVKLMKPQSAQLYADLVVSYTGPEDDTMGPPVRYFFGQ